MSKMGSHCSFGHLKRKLWPKEGPWVELPGVCQFWLPTAKSRESTRNNWLQTTCDIPLKSSRRELQLCFRPHFDPRSARKVMGLQSPGTPAGRDFGTPARESRERKAIWMWVPWRVTEYIIRGKVVASPKSGLWWVLCVCVARGWSQHQRCSNYALTTLCGLCAGPCEWISSSILPRPIPELQHAPLPLKVLWARERIPTPPSSVVFHLDSHLSPARSWECVIQTPWDFGRHIRYMSSIFAQNFNYIDDDHKELSLSKETDFKTKAETLDTWISFNTYANYLKFF
jgi:hypothetical protein